MQSKQIYCTVHSSFVLGECIKNCVFVLHHIPTWKFDWNGWPWQQCCHGAHGLHLWR